MDPPVKQWEPVSPHQHTYIGIYLFFVGILGTLDNGLVVAMFLRFRKLLTPSNLLLLNLCIADLGICLMGGFPFSGTSSFAGKWLWGDWGCQYYAFMGFFFGIGNLTTILMIALDRYLVTCRQDLSDKLTYHRYIQMIIFIWTWSFFWSVCPLLGWARSGYLKMKRGIKVTVSALNWVNNKASYKSFILAVCIVILAVCTVILSKDLCCYRPLGY
ncbi:unnamed protein product, partial [Meganyctiphanes norvegica]